MDSIPEMNVPAPRDSEASGSDWIGPPTTWKNGEDRHCAFCLCHLPADLVKVCSQCHRRAYCSQQCQTKDWRSKNVNDRGGKGLGQGHKDWCGLPIGEEGLDWVVAPVVGRGLGIVAKRFIPANSRIFVSGFKVSNILADLSQTCNSLGRCLMANHECDANSTKFGDLDFKVMGICSKRDIQPGEEICVSYTGLNESYDILPNPFEAGGRPLETFEDCRRILKLKWDISCPSTCFCRTDIDETLIRQGRAWFNTITRNWTHCTQGRNYSRIQAFMDLMYVGILLENHEKIRGSLMQKVEVLEKGFQIAIQQKATLFKAKEFVEEAHKITSKIMHPQGKIAVQIEKWRKDPKSHDKYLAIEDQPMQPEGLKNYLSFDANKVSEFQRVLMGLLNGN